MNKLFWIFILIATLNSCASVKTNTNNTKLKFIGSIELPYQTQFKQTTVGGLSGLDYNNKLNVFYILSDDRSVHDPARFYTAKLNLQEKTIQFLDVTLLKNKNQELYKNFREEPSQSIDPEEIRYHPKTNTIYWTSEGERLPQLNLYQNPSIHVSQPNGNFIKQISLPAILNMNQDSLGPRRNGALESLCFTNDYLEFFTATEEPLYQDSKPSTPDFSGTTRLYQFNTKTNQHLAQYAYVLEKVANHPIPATAITINGITAMLHLGNKKLLVLERSYAAGVASNTIKLFIADYAKATNIKAIKSLAKANQKIQPVQKKLLIDLDSLGIHTDNIEGISWGPVLPNGNSTLVLVSDDNFSNQQTTQFLIFELID